MKVVILTPTLQEGDAVSNDVLGMADTLRRDGVRVVLAVRTVNSRFPVVSYRQVPELLDSPDDVLIYHHSIAFEEAAKLMERLPCRKVVKYHNVTPPEFFQGISKDLIRYCRDGQRQLERILLPGVSVWADSAYNLEAVRELRPDQPTAVLAPFNQVDALCDVPPDAMAVGLADDWVSNILVVGRVVPNKNVVLAVDAFAAYRKRDPSARLVVVGENHHPHYSDQVFEAIRGHGIESNVVMAGKVTLGQLKAYFLTASALLTTSSHEGFCLPLVEGMRMRVPLVAVPTTAIPGTAGDAALYGETAEELADALWRLESDEYLRERQILAGARRFEARFRNDAIAAEFRRLFAAVAEPTLSLSSA